MGTQKNRLNEMVLLSTQNICSNRSIRKYLHFYAQKFCLSKPMVISGTPSELARSCRGAGSCRICCDQQERAENTHEGLDPGTAGDLSR